MRGADAPVGLTGASRQRTGHGAAHGTHGTMAERMDGLQLVNSNGLVVPVAGT